MRPGGRPSFTPSMLADFERWQELIAGSFGPDHDPLPGITPVATSAQVHAMAQSLRHVHMAPGLQSYLVDLADGDDSFTVNGTAPTAVAQNLSHVNLGSGNDTLFAGTVPANFLAAGSHWVGGSGLDTLNFGSNASTGAAATYNFRATTSTGDMVTGCEVFNLDQTEGIDPSKVPAADAVAVAPVPSASGLVNPLNSVSISAGE